MDVWWQIDDLSGVFQGSIFKSACFCHWEDPMIKCLPTWWRGRTDVNMQQTRGEGRPVRAEKKSSKEAVICVRANCSVRPSDLVDWQSKRTEYFAPEETTCSLKGSETCCRQDGGHVEFSTHRSTGGYLKNNQCMNLKHEQRIWGSPMKVIRWLGCGPILSASHLIVEGIQYFLFFYYLHPHKKGTYGPALKIHPVRNSVLIGEV